MHLLLDNSVGLGNIMFDHIEAKSPSLQKICIPSQMTVDRSIPTYVMSKCQVIMSGSNFSRRSFWQTAYV